MGECRMPESLPLVSIVTPLYNEEENVAILGARLAELQLQTLIEELAKRDMTVTLAAEPERIASCFTHGFHHMPVILSKG